jgi:hypothetical protein
MKWMKRIGGAGESVGLATRRKESVLARTGETQTATDCDYKSGTAAAYQGI